VVVGTGILTRFHYRILLDDCLAAVDSHVGRHIFGMLLDLPLLTLSLSTFYRGVDHIIGPDGLLSTKARILVTNNISFIKHLIRSFTFDAVSSWNTVLIRVSSLILIARLQSSCMEYFLI
jgi:hypothetical protein